MRKILIISPDNISEKMAGPAIRYWNFAIQLSSRFNVHLLIPNEVSIKNDKFTISTFSKRQLKKTINDYDAVIIQGLTLFKNPYLKYTKIPLIIDLYDPFVLEMLEERHKNIQYQVDVGILLEQLRCGDFFICASEKQRDFWIGSLIASQRINLNVYKEDRNLRNTIGVVPFGLEMSAPKNLYNPFEKYEGKKIILWGGGIWNWLDPFTLIRAFGKILEKRSDLILFFMGTKHPGDLQEEKKIVGQMKELIHDLKIDKESIVFNDWVSYNERQCYYKNAQIGVTTYYDNLETQFSFRTRILDYFWCELPMVLTKGDTLSSIVEENKCGITVEPLNVELLAKAIENLLDNELYYSKCKDNIASIKEQYNWENAIADLVYLCDIADKKTISRRRMFIERILGILLRFNFYRSKLSDIFKKNAWKKIIRHIQGK